ncbi:hypothetical protein BV25DRAFT_1842720 [Artomyces pyxidatus]|uniref:Uncharacterized protein n=1 Tax=Artomyces pyxidatus TaxID=48021 RepID=A0ACB8SID3_9AGAM|nr:hypothetical protein BV25DRAFT_1842720 [Artomyces pyxidatus]
MTPNTVLSETLSLEEPTSPCPVRESRTASGSTYYERHQIKRLEYQSNYYKVKNNGRRKVGKASRAAAEERRRREIHGERSPYYCSFVHKTPGQDPDRTDKMRAAEEDMWDRCFALTSDLKEREGSGWTSTFLETLDTWIDEALANARGIVASSPDDDRAVQLHGLRRIIAGLVQQKEMAVQSPEAQYAIGEDFAFAWLGRRVNRAAFRVVYGW